MKVIERSLVWALMVNLAFSICAHGQKLHVLMVADTADQKIGRNCQITLQQAREILASHIPQFKYTFYAPMESAKERYSASSIIDRIKSIRVSSADTFAFLYDGHGAYDRRGHFLYMPDTSRFYSADLQDAVERKSCKLRVILTSSCNVPIQVGFARAAEGWNADRQGLSPVMQELFFNHRGLLHMNAAYRDQFGWTSSVNGSIFFSELFGYIDGCPTGRPTWRSIDRRLTRLLSQWFRENYPNGYAEGGHVARDWYPVAWSYPTYLWYDTPRFGATAEEGHTNSGVLVTKVQPTSPSQQLAVWRNGERSGISSLQKGDVITTINGESVTSESGYIEFVSCSPRTIEFTFNREGITYEARTTLAW